MQVLKLIAILGAALVPASALAQQTDWRAVDFAGTGANVILRHVDRLSVTSPTATTREVTIADAYGRAKPMEGADADRLEQRLRFDCTRRTVQPLSAAFKLLNQTIIERPLTKPAEPVGPGTSLDLVLTAACTGNYAAMPPIAYGTLSYDAEKRFKLRSYLFYMDAKTAWEPIVRGGTAPKRLTYFLQYQGTGIEGGGQLTASLLAVHEREGKPPLAAYYIALVTCAARTIEFRVGTAVGPDFKRLSELVPDSGLQTAAPGTVLGSLVTRICDGKRGSLFKGPADAIAGAFTISARQ